MVKKILKMKKFIVLALVISLSLSFFNCSNDNAENQVNFSKISKSKLKQFMLEKRQLLELLK